MMIKAKINKLGWGKQWTNEYTWKFNKIDNSLAIWIKKKWETQSKKFQFHPNIFENPDDIFWKKNICTSNDPDRARSLTKPVMIEEIETAFPSKTL